MRILQVKRRYALRRGDEDGVDNVEKSKKRSNCAANVWITMWIMWTTAVYSYIDMQDDGINMTSAGRKIAA